MLIFYKKALSSFLWQEKFTYMLIQIYWTDHKVSIFYLIPLYWIQARVLVENWKFWRFLKTAMEHCTKRLHQQKHNDTYGLWKTKSGQGAPHNSRSPQWLTVEEFAPTKEMSMRTQPTYAVSFSKFLYSLRVSVPFYNKCLHELVSGDLRNVENLHEYLLCLGKIHQHTIN